MEVTFEPRGAVTKVTILFKNITAGIRPEDNEAGTELSPGKLARYVGQNSETQRPCDSDKSNPNFGY